MCYVMNVDVPGFGRPAMSYRCQPSRYRFRSRQPRVSQILSRPLNRSLRYKHSVPKVSKHILRLFYGENVLSSKWYYFANILFFVTL